MYPGIRYPNTLAGFSVYASDGGVVILAVYVPLPGRYFPCRCPMCGGCEVLCALVVSARVAVVKPVMAQRLHSTEAHGIQLAEEPHRAIATYPTTAFTITSKHVLSFFPIAYDSIILEIHTMVPVFPNRKPGVDRVDSRPIGTSGVMMC